MHRLPCTVLYQSTSLHLRQLYTGLSLLHRQGFIRLSQRLRRTPIRYHRDAPHLREAGHAHLDLVLDGAIRLHFDTHDSQEVALGELDECDFYFKRSCSPQLVSTLPARQRGKVLALGLNYCVVPDGIDLLAAGRSLRAAASGDLRAAQTIRAKLSACRQALALPTPFGHDPRLSSMEQGVDFDAEPRVLFFVAAYDPYDGAARDEDKINERISINETRARCIKALRDALGDKFTGGFVPSVYARQHYAELVADPDATQPSQYFAAVRTHPICVATTGLHGSIGWKLAEYVAFARAIVTEKLVYRVPGDFESGRNYLEFASPDECAAAALRLVGDHDLRQQLMCNNASYYQRHLRPDSLVKNAIETALSLASSGGSLSSSAVVRDPRARHRPQGDKRAPSQNGSSKLPAHSR
jgi:hypothetical protein